MGEKEKVPTLEVALMDAVDISIIKAIAQNIKNSVTV